MHSKEAKMSNHGPFRRFLGALAAGSLVITGLSACNSSRCDDRPADPQCTPLIVATTSAIARVSGQPAVVDITVADLLATASPQVTLSSGSQAIPLTNLEVREGAIRAQLPDSTKATAGYAQLTVGIGVRTGQATLRVYSPPVWQNPLVKTYNTAAKQQALQVFIGKQPGDTQNSLFIGEEDGNGGKIRQVARYVLQGNIFTMPDPTLATNTKTTEPTALFGMTANSILTYYFEPVLYMKKVVKATNLVSGTIAYDTGVIEQDNTPLFASDPQGLLRLLVKNNQLEAFLFDEKYAPISIGTPTLTSAPSLLSARHFDLDGQRRVDAVTFDAGRQLALYSQSLDTGPLALNAELTLAVANAVGSAGVGALDLFDLDGDGNMDVVMALMDSSGNVTDLGWLPYLGKGVFAPLLKAALPMPVMGGLHNLAIGDVTGDGQPDLALATSAAVYVFPN